jgi:endoglucanase
MFGLMNEPNSMDTNLWRDTAQGAINAIRATGASNMILVPGNAWTGAWSWTSNYYGTPNSVAMASITDPKNNFAFEAHQYFDGDSSGKFHL